MARFPRRLAATPLVLLALGVLIALLGVRQWRWLERMGADEHYRLARELGYCAWLFKQSFDHEMTMLARSFERPGPGGEDGAPGLASRLRRWRSTTRWPGLLKAVYRVVRGPAGELVIERLEPDPDRMAPAAWPAEFGPVRRALADYEVADAPVSGMEGFPSVPALLVVAGEAPPAAGERPGAGGPAFLVLHLDREFMAERFLPELVETFFPPPTFPSIEVAVVETAEGGVVYSTMPIETVEDYDGRPEVIYGLLATNADPEVVPFRGRQPRGQEVYPPTRREPTEEDRRWYRELWSRLYYSGHWQIWVRHGGASIGERVEALRGRETRVAFGVLAMLALGIAVFVAGTQRERRFARRQLDLVARVSHELRTPLAVLTTAGDNLADSIVHDRERVARYGRLIQNETRRLREMVENVLHLARRQGARSARPPQPIDVAELVEEALRLSRPQLELAGFEVETSLPEEPVQVLGEPRALRSALLNLISNAVKYGREARWLRVSVAAVRREGEDERDGDGEVEIAVEDRGIGIPAGEIRKLFEPYYRGERARADQIEGTGLGLAVVRDVVAAHRGRITVESAPGRGSTFRLHLPPAESP